jgi:hypothetical protein
MITENRDFPTPRLHLSDRRHPHLGRHVLVKLAQSLPVCALHHKPSTAHQNRKDSVIYGTLWPISLHPGISLLFS